MSLMYAVIMMFMSFSVLAKENSRVINLEEFEQTIYSQNGEDGITLKIFELLGTSSNYYVEFGGYDGYTGSNSRVLYERGWTGLMLDGDYENLSINLQKEFITAENINALFQKYNVPYNLDFLSIDIDFNDFYVWKALDEKYQPRLVVIEYNATHLPNEDKVVEYDPMSSGDSTNYYGASMLAFYNLARKKGYSLVYAEKQGVNLFFVRDDLIKKSHCLFRNINDVEALYVYPQYGHGPNGGHTQDPFFREFLKSSQL